MNEILLFRQPNTKLNFTARHRTPGITRREHNADNGKSGDERHAVRGRVHAVVMPVQGERVILFAG
jgi:hypothetical protein